MGEMLEETPDVEAPSSASDPVESQVEQAVQEAAPAGYTPSAEDFGLLVEAVRNVYERLPEPEQEEIDFTDENTDIGDLIQRYVDERLGEITPYVSAAAEMQGQKQLDGLFQEAEQQFGKFDRDLADKAAKAFFQESGGDPRYARQAALQGAKYAAEQQKKIEAQAIKNYQASLKKTPYDDPGVGGVGVRAPKKDETLDDVIARWSGEEEV